MSTKKLSNIPLSKFRKFLKNQGLNLIRDSKGRTQMTYMNWQPVTRNILHNHVTESAKLWEVTLLFIPPFASADWDPLGADCDF